MDAPSDTDFTIIERLFRVIPLTLIGLFLLWEAYHFGFPDGHLTDFERAISIYQWPLGILGSALGLSVLFLPPSSKGASTAVSAGYLASLLLFWVYRSHMWTVLDHGQGG